MNRNVKGTVVKEVRLNGDILMEDNWIYSGHKFVTINHPQLIVERLKEIIKVSEVNIPYWDDDFKKWIPKNYSLIKFDKNEGIKKGDVLYTHNIYKEH